MMFHFANSATVAQEYARFWVGLESAPVQVVQSGTIIPINPGISTTRQPATTPIFNPSVEIEVNFYNL